MNIDSLYIDGIIRNAIMEDMPYGDITTDNLLNDNDMCNGKFICKESGVISGINVAKRVFTLIDQGIDFFIEINDGQKVEKGDIIARISGKTSSVLKGERTALNLLQRMSGIAGLTSLYVEKVKGYNCRIVDTRKTTPGLRLLEKYAVTCGGGYNHRFSLSDTVLIKDNHIVAAGGIDNAVKIIKTRIPHTTKIEVETETENQVRQAVEAGVDIIMLDNMSPDLMKKCVDYIAGRAITEASGNVTIDTVRKTAETGVDIISVGAITHSVKAMDISLRFE